MFNVTGGEVVIILILALVVLGPEKLPEAMRKFGQFYGEFKKMSTGFQSEMRNALDEPLRELRGTADLAKGIFDQPADELKKTTDALRGAINSTLGTSSPPSIATAPDVAAALAAQQAAAVAAAAELEAGATKPGAAPVEAADAGTTDAATPAADTTDADTPAADSIDLSTPAVDITDDAADDATGSDVAPSTPAAATNTSIDIDDKYALDVEQLEAPEALPFDPGPGPNFFSAAPPRLAEQHIIANAGQAQPDPTDPADAGATSE